MNDIDERPVLKFSIIIFLSVFIILLMEKGKKIESKCNKVMVYAPVKSKWLTGNVCLESIEGLK